MNGISQLLFQADDVNLLGEIASTIKDKTKTLLVTKRLVKKSVLRRPKYTFTFCEQNEDKNNKTFTIQKYKI